MSKIKNLIYLFVFGGALIALKLLVIDKVFGDLPKDAGIWFTSGLLLVVLGIFITEKYFTRSLDVIVNIITLTVVLLTLDRPGDFHLWGALLTYSGLVGLVALFSFVFYDEHKDPNTLLQRAVGIGSTVARFLGSSRMLFSMVFILSIFNYFVASLTKNETITGQQLSIILLIVFWGAILLIEPIDRKLIQPIIDRMNNKSRPRIVGKVSKRMAPNIVVSEAYPDAPAFVPGTFASLDNANQSHGADHHCLMYLYSQNAENKRYDFFYSLSENVDAIADEVFIHVMDADAQSNMASTFSGNELYENKDNLIGFISGGSDIDVVRIKMIDGIDEAKKIREGDLVSVSFYGGPTKYQIINVETSTEGVEGSSKQGGKTIIAQQIGSWEADKQKFEGTGWVPEVNAPVFRETRDEEIDALGGEHYRVGVIPSSKYPIYINLEDSVTHHIAVIGKTGTGKSRMSAKMIEHLATCGYRVVVLEIDQKNKQSLAKRISPSHVSSEQTTWTSEKKTKGTGYKATEYLEWKASTNMDATDGKRVFVVNWENGSTAQDDGPLNQTDGAVAIITDVVRYQLQHPDQKVCIVMEEAYDFIPENNFGQQEYGQPAVSRISQLVLKCRKHNIGFFIITQRTALVSKTILNQCQTILALQSFDETTRGFMGSYINSTYLESMSILRRFQAIVVGKGSTCDRPVIVDFYDKKALTEHEGAADATKAAGTQ